MKIKRCFYKRMHLNNKAQSLVELAIILPIILMLAFGMMAIGFYIYDMLIYSFASDKALDKGISVVISRKLTQNDIDDIKSEVLTYTNGRVFASNPKIDVINNVSQSMGESKLTISIESDFNFKISFVNSILGSNTKITSKNTYIYNK